MTVLVIFNHPPYDGTAVTWNALRLIKQSQSAGMEVRIFLMNEAIDLAREQAQPGGGEDVHAMLLEAVAAGAEAKLCKTCIGRCSVNPAPFAPEVQVGTMPELVDWLAGSDRVLTF
ncbi:MAG: DsrE family protein [Armatimonadetes bacterium]|nr:DsrE family protein [Armatimonadota bacterium]